MKTKGVDPAEFPPRTHNNTVFSNLIKIETADVEKYPLNVGICGSFFFCR